MISEIACQEIISAPFIEKGIKLIVARLDKIHPEINGNKYFKLKYNIEEAKKKNAEALLTFGGAFSNHLLATAFAGKNSGLKTIGIVRGEELNKTSNIILQKCDTLGMKLHFVSREEYRKKEGENFISSLKEKFGGFFLVPEGGSNDLAVKGASEIPVLIKTEFDFICCACGTGGTIAGISKNLKPHQKAIGICAVNAPGYFTEQIPKLLHMNEMPANIILNHEFHFGGYAKSNHELGAFTENFIAQTKIQVDEIYNNKLFFGITELTKRDYFKKSAVIVCLNTGGYL